MTVISNFHQFDKYNYSMQCLVPENIQIPNTEGISGRKIAPNTGANATKFFALATKSLKLVANLLTRISNHTLIPRDLAIVEDLLR